MQIKSNKRLPRVMRKSNGCRLMLMVPVLLLAACASNSPRVEVASPRLPLPPSLTTPMPSQTYSESARLDIQRWQERLTGTQLMRTP